MTAVIGNEACDLDSIVSSVLYGYCEQLEVTESKSSTTINENIIVCVVYCIARRRRWGCTAFAAVYRRQS